MERSYKLRTAIIFLFFCSLYFVAIVNLYLIQVRQKDFYSNLGKKQYNVTITTMPPRAQILDKNGKILAMNKESFAAFILPKEIKDIKKLKKFLNKHFPSSLQKLEQHKDAHFMYVKRKLDDQQKKLIESSGIEDIKLLSEPSRFYTVPCCGTVIGITDIDNNGLFGLELMYNSVLAGTPSTFALEQDARSGHFYFKKEAKVLGQSGQDIKLTIDSDLQFLICEELKNRVEQFQAKEGAVIVMDPANGNIISMVNYPDFDPNNATNLDLDKTRNRIITDTHELGSVIKVFSALAALEEGVVQIDEPIDCQNSKTTYVDGFKIKTRTVSNWENS